MHLCSSVVIVNVIHFLLTCSFAGLLMVTGPSGELLEDLRERPQAVSVRLLDSSTAAISWAPSSQNHNGSLVSVVSTTCLKPSLSQRMENTYCSEVWHGTHHWHRRLKLTRGGVFWINNKKNFLIHIYVFNYIITGKLDEWHHHQPDAGCSIPGGRLSHQWTPDQPAVGARHHRYRWASLYHFMRLFQSHFLFTAPVLPVPLLNPACVGVLCQSPPACASSPFTPWVQRRWSSAGSVHTTLPSGNTCCRPSSSTPSRLPLSGPPTTRSPPPPPSSPQW